MSNARKLRRQLGMNGDTPTLVLIDEVNRFPDTRPGADKVDPKWPASGRYNAYRCGSCERWTVVVHRDPGITPMLIRCKATIGCNGGAMSVGYPEGRTPKKFIDACKHEWYRPESDDPILNNEEMRTYIENGGVALREIKEG